MMQMKLCSRCKKRVAVIYVTKTENGQTTSEGLCLRCAKELGIKPMSDIIRKLGISEEEFDAMADEVAGMIPFVEPDDESDNEGRAPALDFNAIMGGRPAGRTADRARAEREGRRQTQAQIPFPILYGSDRQGARKEAGRRRRP